MLTVLDLFSGIGGFSLGLSKTGGFRTEAFCEIESYPQQVLKKHWPGVPIYDDIQELTSERLVSDGIPAIDVITGGFPCQDISNAGKQAGIEGSRSGLWGEFARLIGEIRPKYAIVENVSALLSGDRGQWFGAVLRDLAGIGYDARWGCISAADCGALHLRNRVWLLSFPNGSQVGHTEHDGLSAASRGGGAQETVREESERAHQSLDTQGTGGVRTSGQYVAYPNSLALWEQSQHQNIEGSAFPSPNGNEQYVAYPNSKRKSQPERGECDIRGWAGNSGEDVAYPSVIRQQGQGEPFDPSGQKKAAKRKAVGSVDGCVGEIGSFESYMGGSPHGVSAWLDGSWEQGLGRTTTNPKNRSVRLKALGNSIVPQIVTAIGQEILKRDSCQPQ